MSNKTIIVGGVAGGASTAARLRRLDENAEILIIEKGPFISFANCGLPYHIGGTIKSRDSLLLQTPEAMKARFNIDVRVENEVITIDKAAKKVQIKNLKSEEVYEEDYDTLVLSPGSTPLRPPIKGIDAKNIFSLWNIPDMDKIISYIKENEVKDAVVVGGGFIGIEMAENLRDLDMEVSLIEMGEQVMAPLDFDMAQIVHSHLEANGVDLYLKNGVESFSYNEDTNTTTVSLQDGSQIDSELVILSIGIRPNSHLAKDAGLELNACGGIVTDEHMKTSDPNIYALGDAAEVTHFITGEKTMIPLAGPANKHGRICADNIVGRDQHVYTGSQGTSVAKIFDLTVSTTGLNEKDLIRAGKEYGKDYHVAIINPKSHAGYYPGAFPMCLKLVFDKQGKVLGAQNVGVEGVEKRIDVIATAIRFGASIYDLQKLELSYAPPYSSAKDPVNMVGFAAENIFNGDQKPILFREVKDIDKENSIILDVRDIEEYNLGSIDGAKHIPVNELRARIDELPKDKEIITYCAIGVRGYIACKMLKQKGYKCRNLIGGYSIYKHYIKDFSKAKTKKNINKASEEELRKEAIKMQETLSKSVQNMNNTPSKEELANACELDACGLQCPGPILSLTNKIKELNDGDILKINATDMGFLEDAKGWAKQTGNTFISSGKEKKSYYVYIKKGSATQATAPTHSFDGSTQVLFSGDLDKAIASMIIANGAAAMGKKVSIFFTFWGLNVLRKREKVAVNKTFKEKMFGFMMPRGTSKLGLSQMNMGGMGAKMIKDTMTEKNVLTLDELMKTALDNGVKFIACTMSMDLMGIKEEELIDGVEYGGVATYLSDANESNHNIFIS